jgi:hypothetical protein
LKVAGVIALVAGGGIVGSTTSEAVTPRAYTAAGSPANIIGGVPTPVTITLKNTTSGGDGLDIGAARVNVPAGMTVSSPVTVVFRNKLGAPKNLPPGQVTSYNATARRIEVSGADVDPGESLELTITVMACPAGAYAWSTDSRESNNFYGPNNMFIRTGSDPITTILPQDACRLGFTGQPTNTFPGTVITTTPYGGAPSTPVAVSALAGNGTALTGWSAAITVTVTGGDPTATLTGGGAVTPVNGVSTYAPSINKKSTVPYALTATSPGLAPATSNGFIVKFGATVECTAALPCSTPTVPGPNGGSVQTTLDQNVAGTLVTEWDPAGEPAPDCAGYDEMPSTLFFNLAGAGSLTGLTKTVTLVAPIPAGSTTKNQAWQQQVCFRAPYAFPGFEIADLLQIVSTGTFATTTAKQVAGVGTASTTDDRWQGLLFSCSLIPALAPCIISRTITVAPTATTAGSATIVLRVPAGDPWAR